MRQKGNVEPSLPPSLPLSLSPSLSLSLSLSLSNAQVGRTSDIEDAIRSGGLAAIKAKRIQEICTTVKLERGKVTLRPGLWHLYTYMYATRRQAVISDRCNPYPLQDLYGRVALRPCPVKYVCMLDPKAPTPPHAPYPPSTLPLLFSLRTGPVTCVFIICAKASIASLTDG